MSDPYLPCHILDASTAVNCMSFSPTGNRLAVGGEDATIRIWDPQAGRLIHCVGLHSPVLCLEWDPLRESRIFYGCQDGTVAYIDSFVDEPNAQRIQTGLDNGQVYALTIDDTSTYVGISIGPEVHIANKLADGTYATLSILPEPKALPNTENRSDRRVRARALRFVKRGGWLIATYLNHGIVCWDVKEAVQLWQIVPSHRNRHIGSSAISPDGHWLLASNLDSGMNLYSLDTFKLSHSYEYDMKPEINYPLSVAFLKKGKYVTCGTHTGSVRIWDTKKEAVQQTLDHPAPLVTCLEVKTTGRNEYIATATGEEKSCIKIWKAPVDHTFQDQVDEFWKWVSLWVIDGKDDKNVQELGMRVVIAIGAFLFARFLYKQHDNPENEMQKTDALISFFSWMKAICIGILTNSAYAFACALDHAYHTTVWCWVTFSVWLKHIIKEWLDLERPQGDLVATFVTKSTNAISGSDGTMITDFLKAEPTSYITTVI